jgi:GrpB-like predicted nucleotidyltransferase (UPF0157 family)
LTDLPDPSRRPGGLRRSDEVIDAAREVLASERRRMAQFHLAGELRLVGGSSLPGLLTHGDIDLLFRVAARDFDAVVTALREVFTPRREDLWSAEMALFLVDPLVPVELAVVSLGSTQDAHFVTAWARLTESAELRERYNRLKTDSAQDYDERKAHFFSEIASRDRSPEVDARSDRRR